MAKNKQNHDPECINIINTIRALHKASPHEVYALNSRLDILISNRLIPTFISNGIFSLFRHLLEPLDDKSLPPDAFILKILGMVEVYTFHKNNPRSKSYDNLLKEFYGSEAIKNLDLESLSFTNQKTDDYVNKKIMVESKVGPIIRFYKEHGNTPQIKRLADKIMKAWIQKIKEE